MKKWLVQSILKIRLGNECLARIVYGALLPEIESPPTYRSLSSIELERHEITLRIRAPDISSFRAAFNSYTRLLQAVLSVIHVICENEKVKGK